MPGHSSLLCADYVPGIHALLCLFKKFVDGRVKPGHDERKLCATRHQLAAHFFFFWYIASMRCVTRKPPKIFTDAKVSATKPKPRAQPPPLPTIATPTASSAPTTITEEIALVTDISGVCSAGVTDHTTKYPTNTASTKIDSRNTKGSTIWAI